MTGAAQALDPAEATLPRPHGWAARVRPALRIGPLGWTMAALALVADLINDTEVTNE